MQVISSYRKKRTGPLLPLPPFHSFRHTYFIMLICILASFLEQDTSLNIEKPLRYRSHVVVERLFKIGFIHQGLLAGPGGRSSQRVRQV